MRRSWMFESEETSIDMSPLIDIIFILLIFFMVSTTFVKDMKMELKRPSASSAQVVPSKSLRVYVDRFRDIYLNNQKIQPWTLQGRIKDQLKNENIKSLLIITDEKVPVDKIIEIVDQAKLAGVADVGIATQGE